MTQPYSQGLLNGERPGSREWNLCYANAVIQAIAPLLHKWSKHSLKAHQTISDSSFELAYFFRLLSKNKRLMSPLDLLKIIDRKGKTFTVGEQDGAFDFYMYLLNFVNTDAFADLFRNLVQILYYSMKRCVSIE